MMPRIVDTPRLVHVIYEREAYGKGLVFDQDGRLKGVLSARSIGQLRRARRRRSNFRRDLHYHILDPKEKRTFEDPWEVRAIENFSRYFSRVFRAGSPLVDSGEIFGRHLWSIVGEAFPAGRVLDLGSGTGQQARALGRRIVGLDLQASPPARKVGGLAVLDRVAGSAQALPFRNDCFSLVLCFFVLEHLSSPFPAIEEICRVLGPGGRVVLAFPSSGVLEVIRAKYFERPLTLPIHHLRSFGLLPFQFVESTRRIIAHLRQGGVQEVRVKAVDVRNPPPDAGSMSKLRNALFPFKYLGTQTVITGTKHGSC